MGKRTILVDDINGSTEDVGPITFKVGGVRYTADLTPANQGDLKASLVALTRFLSVARRLPKETLYGNMSRKERAEVRAFHKLSPKVRVSDDQVKAWMNRAQVKEPG